MEGPDGLLGLIREEAMKVRLRTLAVPVIGSLLPRVLVVVLLTCNTNAASLQPSKTRQKVEEMTTRSMLSKLTSKQ
jgi:hypothetical protein